MGTVLFAFLVGVTLALASLVKLTTSYGLEGWMITTLEACKGAAFAVECFLYLTFVLKCSWKFLVEAWHSG